MDSPKSRLERRLTYTMLGGEGESPPSGVPSEYSKGTIRIKGSEKSVPSRPRPRGIPRFGFVRVRLDSLKHPDPPKYEIQVSTMSKRERRTILRGLNVLKSAERRAAQLEINTVPNRDRKRGGVKFKPDKA